MKRRDFLLAGAALPVAWRATAFQQTHQRPTVCFFSKHLPHLGYDELGRTLKEAGFGGVDLTVRTGGHVLPARAAEDLPRAVEAIRQHALAIPMITTELVSAQDPTARPIVSTAARWKIPFFKLGYWRWGEDVAGTIRKVSSDLRGLTELAAQHGITAGFHNHSGYVGLAIWDTAEMIGRLDPRWIGYYYDGDHATAEGGVGGWQVSLKLALPRLKMVAVKDFYWAKVQGQWKAVSCPLGEGMVNWPKIFALLAAARFAGPISVHQEYPTADPIAAARRDLDFVNRQLAAAYGA